MTGMAENDSIFLKSKLLTQKLDEMMQNQNGLYIKVGEVKDES